eukprot:2970973-Amphidinium_carterae.1
MNSLVFQLSSGCYWCLWHEGASSNLYQKSSAGLRVHTGGCRTISVGTSSGPFGLGGCGSQCFVGHTVTFAIA